MRRSKTPARWQGHSQRDRRPKCFSACIARTRYSLVMTRGFDRVATYEDFVKGLTRSCDLRQSAPLHHAHGQRRARRAGPGWTRNFAQSSGTSDGKSKYIPVTPEIVPLVPLPRRCRCVPIILICTPTAAFFSGKSFILGRQLPTSWTLPPAWRWGPVGQTHEENIKPLVNCSESHQRRSRLMSDWKQKLPALVNASLHENVTKISGVPSWFMTV